MERRLQLLLDKDRYARVAREAERSGRSVSAVIREAIDLRFAPTPDDRAVAIQAFLDATAEPDPGPGEDWADIKESLEERFDLPSVP